MDRRFFIQQRAVWVLLVLLNVPRNHIHFLHYSSLLLRIHHQHTPFFSFQIGIAGNDFNSIALFYMELRKFILLSAHDIYTLEHLGRK